MKTSLEHLPEPKQEELQELTQIILDNPKKIEKVILFGSYARGNWVEDRYTGEDGIVYEYQSDFDILVVTSTPEAAQKQSYWLKIEKKLHRWKTIRTWVSLIVVDIGTLNSELKKGRYFYRDIQKECVVLYDSKNFELAEPKELTAKERKAEAEMYYEQWFESASEFFIDFQNAFKRESWNNAAFSLHQTTERFYMAILLVFTSYKPKLHDLEKLNRQVISQHSAFISIFPQSSEEEKQNFTLLRKAYIDSRYHMDKYRITKKELEWLGQRVEKLKELTQKVCLEKINSFV